MLFMFINNRLRGSWSWYAKVNAILFGLFFLFVFGDRYVAFLATFGYLLGESFGWGEWVGSISGHITKYFRPDTEYTEEGKNNGIRFIATLICEPKQYKLIFSNAKLWWINAYIRSKEIAYNTVYCKIRNLVAKLKICSPVMERDYVYHAEIPLKYSKWLRYCKVALTLRGVWWWLPVFAPLLLIGYSVTKVTVLVGFLAFGFPLACELARYTSKLFSMEYRWSNKSERLAYVVSWKEKEKFSLKFGMSVKGEWEHQEVIYGFMQDLVLLLAVAFAKFPELFLFL